MKGRRSPTTGDIDLNPDPIHRVTTWWYCECGEPLNGRLARDHECEGTDRETEQQTREARHRRRFKQTEGDDGDA